MFGIEIAEIQMRRECGCGHIHFCKAYYVRSTVPLHWRQKRPARSLFWWWAHP